MAEGTITGGGGPGPSAPLVSMLPFGSGVRQLRDPGGSAVGARFRRLPAEAVPGRGGARHCNSLRSGRSSS